MVPHPAYIVPTLDELNIGKLAPMEAVTQSYQSTRATATTSAATHSIRPLNGPMLDRGNVVTDRIEIRVDTCNLKG